MANNNNEYNFAIAPDLGMEDASTLTVADENLFVYDETGLET